MFANFSDDANTGIVKIKKEIKAGSSCENASYCGAFSIDDEVRFSITIPRSMGAYGAAFRINKDGEDYFDLQFSYFETLGSADVYTLDVNMRDLSQNGEGGLFFYEILVLRGEKTLFTSSINNHDFELSYHSDSKFSLLVYSSESEANEWFGDGIMYHIFVDRFAKGEIEPYSRDDVELNEDWYNGIPQFSEIQGASLKNNMFFGGNLAGVCDKLDYIASLGARVIYLSPIFEAYSNHKYDTGDYETVDEMFGGEKALRKLISEAEKKKIKIILDGVFNHTGDNSKYFNRYGNYVSVGAYNDPASSYHNWYTFRSFPEEYDSWWGIRILPRLDQNNPECKKYFVGDGGIIEKYTKMGIGGWRLDVADELPDAFLDELRTRALDSSDGRAVIIGEVWENAAVKTAYGKRRRYFQGKQLDSVMNYPIRNGIIEFVKYGNAEMLYNVLVEIYASYPRHASHSLMNILGTHDTERILTVLGDDYSPNESNRELSTKRMGDSERARAIRLLKLAATIQYTVYGIPSVFYGDEAGIEGYHDPFCRRTFPWGSECAELLEYYRRLGEIRLSEKAFFRGDFNVLCHGESTIAYERKAEDSHILIGANRSNGYYVIRAQGKWGDLVSGESFENEIIIPSDSARILKKL